MKRDMDLVRLILLEIEEKYVSTALCNLQIDGYSMDTVAYHCKILEEAGLISSYNPKYADNRIHSFFVGPLTWEGNDYLDDIREEGMWKMVKEYITKNGLPLMVDIIKAVATTFITDKLKMLNVK